MFKNMDKKRLNLENPDDIEELDRLAFEEIEDGVTVADENFDESDKSETEDNVEKRLVHFDTNHEIDSKEEGGEENAHHDAERKFNGRNCPGLAESIYGSGRNITTEN